MTSSEFALLSHRITHAVMEYDRKQSKRKGYSIYALSHYLGAAKEATEKIERGVPIRAALVSHFCGRLLDVVLKAVGEAPSTDAEQRF